MNQTQLQGMRLLASAMADENCYAAQIEIDGNWQTIISDLTKSQAETYAARWERSRIVKLF